MTAPSIDYGRGRIALVVAHCAGLIDMIGLPLWVGILVDVYRFDPQQAGGMVTVFLGGVFLASVLIAPNFHRISGRAAAVPGFAVAAACFWIAASIHKTEVIAMAHGIAGLAVGLALSVTHGTISTGKQPHRLFGIAGTAVGIFGMVFMAVVPKMIGAFGGPALFVVFGGVMAIATLFALAAFPDKASTLDNEWGKSRPREPLPKAIWAGLASWTLISFAFAMTNAFMERAGINHGFSHEQVATSLLIMATVTMFAGVLAVYLEGRVAIRVVLFLLPVIFASMVSLMLSASKLAMYRIGMATIPASMIIMQVFVFGALSRFDRSGRSLAAFPATIMLGTAVGPVIGGTLVKAFGYGALSMGVVVASLMALLGFLRLAAEYERTIRKTIEQLPETVDAILGPRL